VIAIERAAHVLDPRCGRRAPLGQVRHRERDVEEDRPLVLLADDPGGPQ
jgi:hypothetical protein